MARVTWELNPRLAERFIGTGRRFGTTRSTIQLVQVVVILSQPTRLCGPGIHWNWPVLIAIVVSVPDAAAAP